jgi:type IV pilus assembly protein PilW
MDTSLMMLKQKQGLSLIELMVALLISSVLMAGVLMMMDISKRTYTLQTELAELQDNARFVIDELTRELRMAGHFGCSGLAPKDTAGVEMAPFKAQNTDGKSVNNQRIRDTKDKLVDSSFPYSDTLIMTSFTRQLDVADDRSFNENTSIIPCDCVPKSSGELIVTDCRGEENVSYSTYTFNLTSGANTLTISPALRRKYHPPVYFFIREDLETTYEVRKVTEGGFALFKNGAQQNPAYSEAFIEGVQNMQIRYGIDIDGNNTLDRYTTDPTGGTVLSVRLTLLMRTAQKRGIGKPRDKTYLLDPEVTYNPADNNKFEEGYRHRLFTTTVNVRNSVL